MGVGGGENRRLRAFADHAQAKIAIGGRVPPPVWVAGRPTEQGSACVPSRRASAGRIYAAFGTTIGRRRSASRKAAVGASTATCSPGRPRGGGKAERCARRQAVIDFGGRGAVEGLMRPVVDPGRRQSAFRKRRISSCVLSKIRNRLSASLRKRMRRCSPARNS
jgi:hypothetical protein